MEALKYDEQNRLLYHPAFHPNQGKKWSEKELEYLCKFVDYDGPKSMGMALGRTSMTVASQAAKLKKAGLFEYYRNLNKHW